MRDWMKAVAVGVAAPLAVMIFIMAFMWPMATMESKDIPVAVVGSEEQVAQIENAIDEQKPGLLDIERVDSRDEAQQRVEERKADGAIVLGQQPELLVASAAGSAQAGVVKNLAEPLTAMANKQAQAAAAAKGIPADAVPEVQVEVTDLVPFSADDPQGLGMNFVILPIAIGGLIGGAIASFTLRRPGQRLLAVAIHAPLAGTLVAVVMGPLFGMLPGGFWASAGVLALGIGALSSLIAGLRSVLGIGGFVLGAVFNMLFANPLAGTMAPKEFVAGDWGALGQHLPNGATATLVRSVNYFPSAPIGQPVWTLLAWIAVGVCLLGVGMALGKRGAAAPSAE
ncbi:hypothetical protein VVR85_08485 [Corynebacterium sp. LK2590]|uniref:hypothetical protein n=1 Tax=unclassified Corynebacterium TaxID=2624378 RepID=UPI0034CE3E44